MKTSGFTRATRGALATAGAAFLLAGLSACDLPFGLGTPTERALESGAMASLTASSFEITGSFTDHGDRWSIDLQVRPPNTKHLTVTGPKVNVEALIFGNRAYFRGHQFLSDHMGGDPLSRDLVAAAGNAWWMGSAGLAPQLPDFTDATAFKSTFLGAAVTQRTDGVSVNGVDAVALSGPRADVYLASAPPNRLLYLQTKKGVVVDGIGDVQLQYLNYQKDFGLAPPKDVIDFSNLSTLPPIYSVLSVDTSGCASPCVVRATLRNLGGLTGAKAPSTITFTMTDSASGTAIGSCQAQVIPDVGFNATTAVSCTIPTPNGQPSSSASVTAAPDNPGHA